MNNRKLTKFKIWLKNQNHLSNSIAAPLCIVFILVAFFVMLIVFDYGFNLETISEDIETNQFQGEIE